MNIFLRGIHAIYIFSTAMVFIVLVLGSEHVIASETTYYRSVSSPDANVGFIVMIIEARWLIMKLVGFFTPILVLLFYLSLKYQDKINARSTESSKDEMRDLERFNRAIAGSKSTEKLEIVDVRKRMQNNETPKEYVFQRGQIPFSKAGRARQRV